MIMILNNSLLGNWVRLFLVLLLWGRELEGMFSSEGIAGWGM